MQHSRLPPSSADRWMACPGSIAATDGLASSPSVYALEGIEAHDLLEAALRLGVDPEELVPADNEEAVEMAEAVGQAIDYVHSYLALDPAADFHPEQKLLWGAMFGREDLYGTSDVVIVASDEHVVGDLKYGQGVVVEVDNNTQLKLYALGVRHRYGPRPRYKLIIFQPRARHKDGPIRCWEITDEELLEFAEIARTAIAAAEDPNAPRHAGEHCRWCPASGRCPELADYSLRTAQTEFSLASALDGEVMEPRPTSNLSSQQIAKLLRYTQIVQTWVTALHAEANARALAGDRIPGYKLVAGRSNRAWANPDEAKLDLILAGLTEDEVAPRSMVSPNQAEAALRKHKLLKTNKTIFITHVVKHPGAPTLVSDVDPRPEHVPFSEFTEIPNE